MSYRAYAISLALALLSVAVIVAIAWALPHPLGDYLFSVLGAVAGLGGLLSLGMAVMMPTEVPCAHCGRGNQIHIDALTGKPSLRQGGISGVLPRDRHPNA